MNGLPHLLRGSRVRLALALLANGGGQALAAAAVAWGTRAIFDQPDTAALVVNPFVGLLAAALALAWLRWRERVDAKRLGQHYVVEIRDCLFRHLIRLPAHERLAESKGGTLLKFAGDLTAIRLWVSTGVAPLWVATATLIGAFVALSSLSPLLAIGVCGAVVSGSIGIVFSGAAMRTPVRKARRRRAQPTGDVAERLGNLPVIRAFDQGDREWRRIERRGRSLRDAMIDRAHAVVRGLAELTTGGATILALWIGSGAVGAGQLTTGTVVAAMAVVGVLTPTFKGLARTFEYWNAAKVSREVVSRFLTRATADSLHAAQGNDAGASAAR